MKKSLYILSAIGALSVLAVGCGKFLDTLPDERTDLGNTDNISTLLVSAYPQRSFPAIVHFRCDHVSDYGTTEVGGQPIELISFAGDQFLWNEYNEQSNDSEEQFWQACYKAIAATNHALAALDKLPDDEAARAARGEALLARAFSHHYLVSLFSKWYNPATSTADPGIPYVTTVEDRPIEIYDRGTVAGVYAQIEKDLEEGMPLMTQGSQYKVPKYHFTRRSAAAFASRFYLMKGDYGKVIQYASEIIPQPVKFVNIVNESGNTVKDKDGQPAVNVDPTDPAAEQVAANFHPFISEYANKSTAQGIMGAFTDSDAPGNLLVTETITCLPLTYYYYYSRYGMTKPDAAELVASVTGTGGQWVFQAMTYASGDGGICWFIPKYPELQKKESVAAGSYIPYTVTPVLRVEEVLLNRAEAYAMQGEYKKAIADMNLYLSQRVVRDPYSLSGRKYDPNQHYLSINRALTATSGERGLSDHFLNTNSVTASWPDEQKAIIILLLRYRDTEFWQEGLRWYDIRRWNIPVTHTKASGESSTLLPGDDRLLLQIPESGKLSGVPKNDRTPAPEWKKVSVHDTPSIQ